MKNLIEFSKLKLGQKVWTIQDGYCQISSFKNDDVYYPIVAGYHSYSSDGKRCFKDEAPSLFLSNPFEDDDERLVEVRQAESDKWVKRVFIAKNRGRFICFSNSETIENSVNSMNLSFWNYMREIQPNLELTLKEIAVKYGVESVKIIDK